MSNADSWSASIVVALFVVGGIFVIFFGMVDEGRKFRRGCYIVGTILVLIGFAFLFYELSVIKPVGQ